MNIPDWVDRRTVEWAASVCDHVSAGFLVAASQGHRAHGARACATVLRAAMRSERPQLPAVVVSAGPGGTWEVNL